MSSAISATAVTVTLIVVVSTLPSASVTDTSKLSLPFQSAVGVYDHAPVAASIVATPLVDPLVTAKSVGLGTPSDVSVKVNVPVIAPPSSVPVPEFPPKVPGSFT